MCDTLATFTFSHSFALLALFRPAVSITMTTASGQKLLHTDCSAVDNLLVRHFTGSTLLSALNHNQQVYSDGPNTAPVAVPVNRPNRPNIPPPPPPSEAIRRDVPCPDTPDTCPAAHDDADAPESTALDGHTSTSDTYVRSHPDSPTLDHSDDTTLIAWSGSSDCSGSIYQLSVAHTDDPLKSQQRHCAPAVRAESFSSASCISTRSAASSLSITSRQTDRSSVSPAPSCTPSAASLVKADKCACHCHCKARRSSTKTSKLFSSLAKLTINSLRSGLDVRLVASKRSPTASLSSLGSVGASLSGGSSVQENQYSGATLNAPIATIQVRPNRPPPPPPSAASTFRTAALLPEPEYEDSYGLRRSVENLLRERFAEYADVADLLYERLDLNDGRKAEGDYDSVKDDDDDLEEDEDDETELDGERALDDEEEEDLYQDVLLFESSHDADLESRNDKECGERIYETLSMEQAHLYGKALSENVYSNRDTINEMDRKLIRQQKLQDKKRRIQAAKLQRKFNLSGNEIPLNAGVVKTDVRGNQMDLRIHKNEIVLILRIDGNPPGKWLAKNERGKIGYVDLDLIDVDIESIKSLMNVPNVLTENTY
jgi:hypothetical protein